MNTRKVFRISLVAAATVLAVAACGGGGGSGGYPVVIGPGTGTGQATTIPGTALASVTTLYAYMKELITSSSDTSEPVQLGDAVLPVDNGAEPSPL